MSKTHLVRDTVCVELDTRRKTSRDIRRKQSERDKDR